MFFDIVYYYNKLFLLTIKLREMEMYNIKLEKTSSDQSRILKCFDTPTPHNWARLWKGELLFREKPYGPYGDIFELIKINIFSDKGELIFSNLKEDSVSLLTENFVRYFIIENNENKKPSGKISHERLFFLNK